MRHLRRQRDFLAWLMSVAVSCNIILAMLCCTPLGMAHGGGPGDDFTGVLCTTGATASGLQAATPDGQQPSGHKTLHSQCVLCGHAPGGSLAPVPAPIDAQLFAANTGQNIAFGPEALLPSSHFAFAEPSSRGPPRA